MRGRQSVKAKLIKNKKQEKRKACRRYKYSQADLDGALMLIEKDASLRKASQLFKVPKSTLLLKSQSNNKTKIIRPEPKSILSVEEEKKIVS